MATTYTFHKGPDTGGGYVNCLDVHPTILGLAACGGDQFGPHTTATAGGALGDGATYDGWQARLGGAATNADVGTKAVGMSQKNPGKVYVGIGLMQSTGGRFATCSTTDYHLTTIASIGFGTGLAGGNGTRPRCAGNWIQIDYDSANNIEYVYFLAGSALHRYTDTTGNISTLASLGNGIWSSLGYDPSKQVLYPVQYAGSGGGGFSSGTVWSVGYVGNIRTGSGLTPTTQTNAPGVVNDMYYDPTTTSMYAATGTSTGKVYKVTGDNAWSAVGNNITGQGGVMSSVCRSPGTGNFYATFCSPTSGGGTVRSTDGGTNWSPIIGWVGNEWGKTEQGMINRPWWLYALHNNKQYPGQVNCDARTIRCQYNAATSKDYLYIVGSGGSYVSVDSGGTWRPAALGLGGGEDTNGLTVSGGTVAWANFDWGTCNSTNNMKTVTSMPCTTGSGGCSVAGAQNHPAGWSVTKNAQGIWDIQDPSGTIANDYFRGAMVGDTLKWTVDTSNNFVYLTQFSGASLYGFPGSGPPTLVAPSLSTPTVSGLTINSSWSAATGGTGTITYQVFLGTTNPPTTHHTPSSGASGTTDSNTLPAGSSGNYFLFVRATDSGSPAQTADSAQFTVPIGVLTPPVITAPAAGSTVNNFTLNAAWNPATGGTGIYTLYEVSYDNAAYQTASSGVAGLTDQHVFTTNGPHTLKVRVTDSGGSQAASGNVSFTINGLISGSVTAPTLNQVLPSGTVVTTWSAATGGIAPYTYTIQYDALAFRAPSGSLTDTTTLTNGAHAVRVRATDSASNVVTSTQIPFSVAALSAPTPSSTVAGATATTTWGNATGGTGPYTYQVSYNGGAFLTPSGANQDVRTFANGSYTVIVKATDSASRTANSTAGSFTITVSLSPPSITAPTANQIITTANFTTTWNAGPGGVAPITFQVSYNNGTSYHTPSSGAGGLSDLFTFADGSYTALVKETDTNGLTATSAPIAFQIATTHPPAPTIDTGPTAASGGSTPNTTASFSFHEPAWANPVTFAASVTGPVNFGNAAVTSPKTYSGLTAGTYTFSLTATDSVTGLSSSAATWVWTVSVVLPPEIPVITSGPSQGGQSGDFTVTISNTGTANLLIGTLSLSGANASEFDIKTDNASGRTVLPGGSLTVILFFAPSSLGTRTAILNIPNNADTNHTITLTGTGVPVGTPIASVTPSSVAFGQVFFGDTSPPVTVTLRNTGLSGNLVTDVSTITGSASFVIINDNISGQSFAPGASGTLQLTYAPQSGSEVATGTLIITDNSNNVFGSTQSIGLTGSGKLRVAGISISPASLTYPTRTVGTTSPAQSITVTSTGSGNLVLGTVTKTGANAADFTITANTVSGKTFGPTGGPTPFVNTGFEGALTDGGWTDEFGSGSLSIVSSPVRHGVGALEIDATLGDATGDILRYRNLASVNTLVFQFYIQIPSLPTAQAAILEAAGTGSGNPLAELVVTTAGKISISIVPANVLLSQTLSTNTWYLIDGLIDYSTTTLTMRTQISDTNATLLSSGVVTLAGTAQPGFAQLALGKIASGESAFIDDFRLQQSGYPILTGTSGSISVTFSPSAAGALTASLSIPDNAAGSPQTVLLSGTGLLTVPGISITPNPISFATTVIGSTSATQTATITNTGTADLIIGTVSLVGAEAGQFAIQTDNASGQTITPSGTRTVVMTFKPTLVGSHSATLSLTDNATGSPHTAILSGLGTIPSIPPLGHTVYAYYYPNYGLSAAEGFGSESYQGWGGTFPAPLGSGVTHTFAPATSIASDYYPADYWTGAAGYPPKLYSSSDPVLLKAQCVAAIQAGINVFTVSWKPPPDRSDTLVSALLSAAQAATNQTGTPIYIAFLIEPWASCSFTDPTDSTAVTGGRSNAKVWRAINYLNSTYGGHPNFYRSARVGWHYAGRVAGTNLFSLNHPEYDFLTGGAPNAVIDPNGTYWQTTTDNVHNPAKVPLGGLILAESSFNPTQVDEQHFDGGFIYLSLPLKQSGALDTDQYQYRRVYELGFPPTAICIPSIAPGYSAWRIQDTLDRRFLRSNGGFFDTQWYQALNGVALYDVAITSFNDWQHGTQIESATNQTLGTGQ